MANSLIISTGEESPIPLVSAAAPPKNPATEGPEKIKRMRRIIKDFIAQLPPAGVRFDPPAVEQLHAAALEEAIRLGIDMTSIEHWLLWCCQLIQALYPEHPQALQVLLAISTLTVFYIEDKMANENPSNLHLFLVNLVAGNRQADPILNILVTHLLPSMWTYFHPLAANSIIVAFIEFINGTVIEGMKLSRGSVTAAAFPEYVRAKSGIPAAYVLWMFPKAQFPDIANYIQAIPDLLGFTNHANDVFSAYKEELDGEKDNYMHMRAQVAGQDVLDTLQDLARETIEEMKRIKVELSKDEEAYKAFFTGLLEGYTRFHLSASRYRMKELLQAEHD